MGPGPGALLIYGRAAVLILPLPLIWLDSRNSGEALIRISLALVLGLVIFRAPLSSQDGAVRGWRAALLLILGTFLAVALVAGLGAEAANSAQPRASLWPGWLALFLLWEKWRHAESKRGEG